MIWQNGLGSRLLAATAGVSLMAVACTSDEPTPDETTPVTPAEDYCADGAERDLVWLHDEQPRNLHLDDPDNNQGITSWVRQSLWEGLYGVTASTEFFPELLAEDATVTANADGSVSFAFRLRENLSWSDGTALTAEHVKGTFDIKMEGYDYNAPEGADPSANAVYLMLERTGYDLIDPESWELTSDTEFSFTMTEFWAGWPVLFAEIFPTHVVPDAATANQVFPSFEIDGVALPSSGPLLYGGHEPDESMSLRRNDAYHGSTSPDVRNGGAACVSGVEIRFNLGNNSTEAMIEQLGAGEGDFMMARPQLAFFERLVARDEITAASTAGPEWEHWGMNLNNPHLADPLVREAIAYAIDKHEVMDLLYTPLFGDALPEEGLGNAYWTTDQEPYEDQQVEYDGYQPDIAAEQLEAAGYVRGDDGVFSHPERGRLSLRIGTTGDNLLRERQQLLVQAQLVEAGIDIQIDNRPDDRYFGEVLFSPGSQGCSFTGVHGSTEHPYLDEAGNPVPADCQLWDLTQFAWVGSPWPGASSSSFVSRSDLNPYGYRNSAFDARAAECDRTIDDVDRAACYNELSRYVTTLEIDAQTGLFIIPLTQKPSFYAFHNVRLARAAVAPDAHTAGPLANVVDFVTTN